MRQSLAIVTCLLAGWVGTAEAQFVGRWYSPVGVGLGYGYGYGGGVGSSVSLQQQAIASTIQAEGQFLQSQSQAMINAEQARSQYIDNQQKWTQVYMERKRALQGLYAERQEYNRAKHARTQEYYATRDPEPLPRLSSSQLNSASGEIHWPDVLRSPAFQSERQKLDDLFALRAKTDTIPGLSNQIDSAVREMRNNLRSRIRDIDTQDYIAARKFLDALAVEGSSAAD